MLGLNIEALAKTEIAKVEAKLKAIDVDHNGISDLAEIETLVTEAVAGIKLLETKVTPAEIATALNLLFPGKFTAEEVVAAEGALGKLITAAEKLQALAAVAKTAL